MQILVVITTWQVPYSQVVRDKCEFWGPGAALRATNYINEWAKRWWDENEGERSVAEGMAQPFKPIEELGYDSAHWELWGGEAGCEAMLDEASYAELHELHYRVNYDQQGKARPGYLINSYAAGKKPGGSTEEEIAKYQQQAKEGIQKVFLHYGKCEGNS